MTSVSAMTEDFFTNKYINFFIEIYIQIYAYIKYYQIALLCLLYLSVDIQQIKIQMEIN